MGRRGALDVDRVCCLLHNLLPGGSGRQWLQLLSAHGPAGGEATIVAPPAPLSASAEAAGIELIEVYWEDGLPQGHDALWHVVGGHDVAVVPRDHGVMKAFAPALTAGGRAVLAVNQAPEGMGRR